MAISCAPLGRIRVDNSRKETGGFSGDGYDSHGEPTNFETNPTHGPSAEVRDVQLCCKEEIVGILKYMIIWKPEWAASKSLLRRMGLSMVESVIMTANPPKIEVPLSHFVKMNILLWNCRGALNADFKRRIFEMTINHRPSILVVTEMRIGGGRGRAKKIIEGLPFDGYITTDTIGYAEGLWIL